MAEFSRAASANSPVCVLGRTDFSTGIGSVAHAAAELFARTIPTCFHRVHGGISEGNFVTLPNGRRIAECGAADLAAKRFLFYCDVLWNGRHDRNHTLVPTEGDAVRIAHIAWDSDRLPSEWVGILNERFDAVLFTSSHLEAVALHSGVGIPVGTLPVALDLDDFLLTPLSTAYRKKTRLGAVASFHRRKGVLQLIEAFAEEFHARDDVELLIHSNLAIDDTFEKAERLIRERALSHVMLSRSTLDRDAKRRLMDSIDIYCSCSIGEGYSIGPREALALGKIVALTDIGAHRELLAAPGAFAIPVSVETPAVYPEIDGNVYGSQKAAVISEVRQVLRAAVEYAGTKQSLETALDRRHLAAQYSFSALQHRYAALVLGRQDTPGAPATRGAAAHIPPRIAEKSLQSLGRFRKHTGLLSKTTVPCHDGGFFSVFNVFMSNLVWDLGDPRCLGVFPDWDVERFLTRLNGKNPLSFCYGQRSDGNLWLAFFEPLQGATPAEMNDPDFLYAQSRLPSYRFNEHREPLLTYTNARALYDAKWFRHFRHQYNRVLRRHVHLRSSLHNEIEDFCQRFHGRFMIAAHVKHPSHIVEQPSGTIAATRDYFLMIRSVLQRRQIAEERQDWGIFLATDRDAVVDEFLDRFGDRVHVLRDVRRTSRAEDAKFLALSELERRSEGHMVQHLVAADPQSWSTRMGWEVIRDTYIMARCHVLLHVVSNISTAVSYINPEIELVHVDP